MQHHIRSGFVRSDETTLFDREDGFWSIEGQIRCLGSLYMTIDKRLAWWLDRDEIAWTQTVTYAYNGVIDRVGNLFRYNSAHSHRPVDHVHEYDVLNSDKEGTVRELDEEGWPTLSEAIIRFRDWYYDNLDELAARGLAEETRHSDDHSR